MKKQLFTVLLLSVWALQTRAQVAFVPESNQGIQLTYTCSALFDGKIVSVFTFDTYTCSDYHQRLNSCLSPLLLPSEQDPCDLLMTGAYLRIYGTTIILNPGSSYPNNEEVSQEYARAHPFINEESGKISTGNGMKGAAVLYYIGEQTVKALTQNPNRGGGNTDSTPPK
jgi:hypothetical protein